VIPDTEPAKNRQLPLQWIVPLIFVVIAGSLGLFVKELRSPSGLLPFLPNPTPTQKPTTQATPAARSLDNLSPGWVIKTNNQISLGNKQSLPPGAFLQVINTNPNPKPASGNLSVSMQVCPSKNTQTPANTNKPPVTSSVPPNLKPLPQTVLLELSQLKRFGVSVLQSDVPNPCPTVTQPPATPSADTSPT
jgi:protein phosphatase